MKMIHGMPKIGDVFETVDSAVLSEQDCFHEILRNKSRMRSDAPPCARAIIVMTRTSKGSKVDADTFRRAVGGAANAAHADAGLALPAFVGQVSNLSGYRLGLDI